MRTIQKMRASALVGAGELALAITLTGLAFAGFFALSVTTPASRLWRWLRAGATRSSRASGLLKSNTSAKPHEPFRRTLRRGRRRLGRTFEAVSAATMPGPDTEFRIDPSDLSRLEGEGGPILPETPRRPGDKAATNERTSSARPSALP